MQTKQNIIRAIDHSDVWYAAGSASRATRNPAVDRILRRARRDRTVDEVMLEIADRDPRQA